MTRILGIDPGSRVTGYGVIAMERGTPRHLAHGCIRTAGADLAARLRVIYDGLTEVIDGYGPEEMAVEKVFVKRNAAAALTLGQALGAAIVAGSARGLPVFEFTPAEVKQAVVGTGRADKEQVQHMVRVLLRLPEDAARDAADALAVALCHGHRQHSLTRMRLDLGGGRR